jgi:hypothetical protein
MSLVIGIAATDDDLHWFWSLLVRQCEWTARCWDTRGELPDDAVDAWIALVPRPYARHSLALPQLWLSRLNVPTLLLGTPLAVACAVRPAVPAPVIATTQASAIAHLNVLLPLVIAVAQAEKPNDARTQASVMSTFT